jgi:hypothetical protein
MDMPMNELQPANAKVTHSRPLPRWALTLTPFAMVTFALLWLWSPVLDGAAEILYPGGSGLFLWELAAPGVGVVTLIVHVSLFGIVIAKTRSIKYVILMLLPIGVAAGVILGLYPILYPAGVSRPEKRIDSCQLGARMALRRAGGPAKVREEALTLLATGLNGTRLSWREPFRGLRAVQVEANQKARWVEVKIPQRRFIFWGDQFGYLILGRDANEPVMANLHDGRTYRLWKIDEGIYLYEDPY